MATKITRTTATTTALILATFALVGIMTTGAIVPAAFAQTADDPFTSPGGLLDQFLADTPTNGNGGGSSSNGGGNGITDGPETTRETTEQTEDQSEQNTQSNAIDQDQTAAINEEIASGSGSEAASAANSESESTYKPKYKSKDGGSGSPIPGESTAASDSTSDVSNNGTIAQDQTLSSPVQVNDNNFGSDESRSAVVGFDLGFEQFTAETGSAEPDIGTRVPIVIP
ncbi:MAG: hypothetical protein M3114_08395 [Thermoproteota archaeon]|nr:hypothetical protein [Thermoproteota archaeon]